MGTRKTGLLHELKWYHETYGIPLQTVINARNRGWPLDNPERLLRKYEALTGKKPPLDALRAIVNGTPGARIGQRGSSRNDPPPKTESPPAPPPSGEPRSTKDIVFGLQAELERLQEETARSYKDYTDEKQPGDKIAKQKIYLANVNALRALAKDAPKADEANRNSVSISDVDSTWARALKEFRSQLEALPRRVSTSPLFRGVDPVDVELLVRGETDKLLAHLETGSWLKSEEPAQ
jgi:hypothetical protein